MNRVMVLGSINVDTTLHLDHLPHPGETIFARQKTWAGGGKGANQAIAASRLGAQISFMGKVGEDSHGKAMIEALNKEGIDTSRIRISEQGTGEACILLDPAGQNSIIVHPGANQDIRSEDIDRLLSGMADYDLLMTQFETPVAAAVRAFRMAKERHVLTVLNPAPALESVDPELYQLTDLIIPNETESEALTGIKITNEASMKRSTAFFTEKGVGAAVITLGAEGAYYDLPEKGSGIIPAHKVRVVDTTAAGDTFIGALSTRLNRNLSNLAEAVAYANVAASLTVQQLGAQPSIPARKAVEAVEQSGTNGYRYH
ncbi:ribokinase [Sporolactobacillus sp. Y61]|uniref:Ribokinase n=1 Tax=Sporolactobacillus sp. Y61 TaxID=3160863 RepID=A0AAU8IJA3_9BACL